MAILNWLKQRPALHFLPISVNTFNRKELIQIPEIMAEKSAFVAGETMFFPKENLLQFITFDVKTFVFNKLHHK